MNASATDTGKPAGLLQGRKHAPANLGRVLVLGLGKSGSIAADYFLGLLGVRVDSVCIAAGPDTDDNRKRGDAFEERGASVVYGQAAPDGDFDLCVASPGISELSGFYRSAKAVSAEVISEVELAWRESADDSRWVAVTGTNGKTTTTALAAHLLAGCGMRAAAVGNIGDTCLAAVMEGRTDVYVAEVSSYQLASTRLFAPDVAVLLNITPDHLKWHGGMDAYIAAKARVHANLAQVGGVAVMDATNDIVRAQVRAMKAVPDGERGFSYVPMGTADGIAGDMRRACGSRNAAFIEEGVLCVCIDGREVRLVRQDELLIPGDHNAGNALAASAAALAMGTDAESVRAGLRSFAPLEHRIEPCGTVAGVECFNDSKATNVDATLKALAAFGDRRPIVLFGGDDKGTDLDELVRTSAERCKAAVCYGEAGPRFSRALAPSGLPVYDACHMADALDAAFGLARPGDIVLLSPACASFDEFGSYRERGAVFKQLVARRAAETGA